MTFNRGNRRAAKVNGETVIVIRQLYEQGWTQNQLSREFQLSIGQIGRIVRGEVWQNVTQGEPINRAPPSGGPLPTESEAAEGAAVLTRMLHQVNKEVEKHRVADKALDELSGDKRDPKPL